MTQKFHFMINLHESYVAELGFEIILFVCLRWDFTAQSTQWGHVEYRQFT